MTTLYGHAQRRAVRARTLTRAGWRELMSTLRKARRSAATERRAWDCLGDLARDSGTDRGDILAIRQWSLGAYGGGSDPGDCCGLSVVRAALALKWYPLPRGAR